MKTLFRSYYLCSECGEEWHDVWDCNCNDRCPNCDSEIEPYDFEEMEVMEEEYNQVMKDSQ